jgi:hypothetical protein
LQAEVLLPVVDARLTVERGYRVDLLVAGRLIVDVKAVASAKGSAA